MPGEKSFCGGIGNFRFCRGELTLNDTMLCVEFYISCVYIYLLKIERHGFIVLFSFWNLFSLFTQKAQEEYCSSHVSD